MGLAVALFGRNPKGGEPTLAGNSRTCEFVWLGCGSRTCEFCLAWVWQPNLRILFGLGVAAEPANFVWLGWQDLNLRMRESKSRALPLGDTPMLGRMPQKKWGGRQVSNLLPPEPQSGALPIELRPPYFMVRPERLEPPTHGLEGRCSILLSYGRVSIFFVARLNLKKRWSG